MDKVVIAGIDSIAGANLAASLSERFQVVGLSFSHLIHIEGCETAVCLPDDPQAIEGWVEAERPQWLVYCGPAAHPSWEGRELPREFQALQWARPWARAAAACGCELTVISSDGVFAGPWMFHDEDSASFCESRTAQTIRSIEQELRGIYPQCLIARTNVFGWSPLATAPGLAEQILSGTPGLKLDCVRHATPILATDLAEILAAAFERRLQGIQHIGGAERVNPYRFGAVLADRFECSCPPPAEFESLTLRRGIFGAGETSLRSRLIRSHLGIPLPLLGEGLTRMHAQLEDGFPDRFKSSAVEVHELVA